LGPNPRRILAELSPLTHKEKARRRMCSLDSRTHTHDLLPLQPHPLPIAELPTRSTRYTLQDGEAMGLSVRSRA